MVPHLICFGDSLTAGYQSAGLGDDIHTDTPPGGFLQSWLGSRGKVTVAGICGEVTQEMLERFHRDVVQHHPETVVILGGTNDLGCGLTPPSIHTNLQHLFRQAQDAGIQAVGVTIPSLCVCDEPLMASGQTSQEPSKEVPLWVQSHINHRRTLNHMIQETCEALQMACVDLFQGTSEEPQGLLSPAYSNDGLHLSTLGYERFAELVWEVVFEKRFGACPRNESNKEGLH